MRKWLIMDLGICARLHSWQVLFGDVTTHNSFQLLFAKNTYGLTWDYMAGSPDPTKIRNHVKQISVIWEPLVRAL